MPALITPGPACVPCSGILTSPEISGLQKSSVTVLLKTLNTLDRNSCTRLEFKLEKGEAPSIVSE